MEPLLRRSKRTGLLAYLAAARPRGFHRRDKLLGLFWPEADEAHARAALSQALYVLRNALGNQAVVTRGEGEVALSVEVVWCDVVAFEVALDGDRPGEALALYRGDLLDGFFVMGAPEFQWWVDGERTRLRQRAAEGAWALAEDRAADGEAVEAARWARRAGELLPDDEAVTRRLMTFLQRLGDRAAAIRAYEAFAWRLEREHELKPSAETEALAATIREDQSRAVRQSQVVGAAGVEPARIAVLPLANRTGDPEKQDFVDAMHDALITELAQISALAVISRQSVLRYRETEKSIPEIAWELDVGTVVEGSVFRVGDKVRITVQLLQARPAERHLWAESFERDLRGVLALHGDVARAVAERIQVAVTPDELTRLARGRLVDPAAYHAWLRGWVAVMYKLAGPQLRRGIAHANEAIAIDPGYAPAHALAAGCYVNLTYFTATAPQDAFPQAKVAARRALDVDPFLGGAHMMLALVHGLYEWDWSGADRAFRRAIELAPSDGLAHAMYGMFLALMGRIEEAITHARRAEVLSPGVPVERQNLAMVLYLARRYDEAIEQAQRTIDLAPGFGVAYDRLASAYEAKEMYDEAVAAREKAAALMGDVRRKGFLAHAYGLAGRRDEALRMLAELLALREKSYVPPTSVSVTYLGLGQLDEAIAWLEKGYDRRDGDMVLLQSWPLLDPLRSDARFQRLLGRMGFSPS